MEEIIQGTPEWFAARLGKVTASRVADVIAKTKTGWGASRANYMAELVAERLTGASADKFSNAAMQWGTEQEPEARAAYEFRVGADVLQIGFVPHPIIPMTGASPDGLVGDEGLVEIKCPNTATHIDTLISQSIPGKYVTQMLWQMACTGRQWCDFISFDPRLPPSMRLFVKRLERDEVRIKELEKDIAEFLAEVEHKVNQLVSLYEREAA
jgi:putative phage-type endonuclease